MKNFERIFVGIAVVSLVMKFFLVTGGNILFALSLASLISLYFFFGFAYFNNLMLNQIFKKESYSNISSVKLFTVIFSGIAMAVSLTGMMFYLLHWAGQTLILYLGILISIPLFPILLLNFKDDFQGSFRKIFIRLATTFFVAILFVIIPESLVIKIQYKNYPQYLNSAERYYKNPTDENLKKRIKEHDRIIMNEKEFDYYYHEKK